MAPFFGPWNEVWRAVPQFAWRHRTRSRAGMPPKIKLVAKSDAEIALEKKYELLRKQRAGVAAGPAPPGANRVGDPGRTAAVASSSAAGSGPSKDAPGGGDQKPMTAFERAKLMLARDAERKRGEAEKRKAKQASSRPSSDDPFAAHGRREEDSSRDASTLPKPLPKKKTPPLKRPAARPSAAAAHKRPRDETYAYATGDAGAHETPSAYASTIPATTTAPPPSSADPSAPRVVFVSDLPEACAAESLASALYRFGNVDDARVAEGRRFGFVTFAEPEGAAKAVRAAQAAAAGEGAGVAVANQTVTISFARGKSGAGDPAANAALYALEIKNKAASMATEENGARRAPEPEKLREMVTYDDI